MAKLTKAQKEVLTKLRDGWILEGVWYPRPILQSPEAKVIKSIAWQVARSLNDKGLVKLRCDSPLLYDITPAGLEALKESSHV